MGTTKLIRKMIDGESYTYDRVKDVIYAGKCYQPHPYNRTQVSRPVDLCLEITTSCNMTCRNCFSKSSASNMGIHASLSGIEESIQKLAPEIIRACVTGGEPMIHPNVDSILQLPSKIKGCGFVLSTNGTLRGDLDDLLIDNEWLVAISLHGARDRHNAYTRTLSFDTVVGRIRKLAPRTTVHLYTVLHDEITKEDLRWLFNFRDEFGIAFLRFIVPRPFGRYELLQRESIIKMATNMLDDRSGIKTSSSLTRFINIRFEHRLSS